MARRSPRCTACTSASCSSTGTWPGKITFRIPRCYYGDGDAETVAYILLLEDLAHHGHPRRPARRLQPRAGARRRSRARRASREVVASPSPRHDAVARRRHRSRARLDGAGLRAVVDRVPRAISATRFSPDVHDVIPTLGESDAEDARRLRPTAPSRSPTATIAPTTCSSASPAAATTSPSSTGSRRTRAGARTISRTSSAAASRRISASNTRRRSATCTTPPSRQPESDYDRQQLRRRLRALAACLPCHLRGHRRYCRHGQRPRPGPVPRDLRAPEWRPRRRQLPLLPARVMQPPTALSR